MPPGTLSVLPVTDARPKTRVIGQTLWRRHDGRRAWRRAVVERQRVVHLVMSASL